MPRALLLVLLLCSACSAAPAPIAYGGREDRADEEQPRVRAPRPEPNWAAGEGTPLSAYALRPEDVQPHDPLRLPRSHRVREGESLYDIATAYRVPITALIDQNGLEPPYALAPGREIALPPPRVHVVARGESFEDVARRHDIDPRSLALLNGMQPPYVVRAGQRIALPAVAQTQTAPPEQASASSPTNARFVRPLGGEIVAQFGAQPGGQRLDGVEIAGSIGAAIVAAADGEVVYAGDDLPGYGHLVILAHADNYVTAYGYARAVTVREGQRVRAGQPIAELGERADGRARLLFQVRHGGQVVDPTPLLGMRDLGTGARAAN